MPRIPQTIDQLRGDYYMLGIKTIEPGRYLVGQWYLYGPAMEVVRQSPFLRTALLLANPNVPAYIKRMFASNPEEDQQ